MGYLIFCYPRLQFLDYSFIKLCATYGFLYLLFVFFFSLFDIFTAFITSIRFFSTKLTRLLMTDFTTRSIFLMSLEVVLREVISLLNGLKFSSANMFFCMKFMKSQTLAAKIFLIRNFVQLVSFLLP